MRIDRSSPNINVSELISVKIKSELRVETAALLAI
jgi:hypothetical protein